MFPCSTEFYISFRYEWICKEWRDIDNLTCETLGEDAISRHGYSNNLGLHRHPIKTLAVIPPQPLFHLLTVISKTSADVASLPLSAK